MSDDPNVLRRALDRERKRRAHAEHLLEEKSRALFESYADLEKAHEALKCNQKQLVRSEKLASLGTLSAGMAHEINNPIGFVLSNLNSLNEYVPAIRQLHEEIIDLLNKVPDASPLAEDRQRLRAFLDDEDMEFIMEDTGDLLRESLQGVTRVRDIVAGLKTFARQGDRTLTELDLNHVVNETLTLARRQIESNSEVITELAAIPPVMGTEGRLMQVLTNLVVNASQAVCPKKGRIVVRTRVDGDDVVIEVQDNGHGMTEEVQEKLFTPFFTTKGVGKGTGLGLSISFGIIEEHNGRIEVKSAPGEGTTFSVYLPKA